MIQRFRSRAVMIGAAVALAVGLGSAAFAQGDGPGRRGGMRGFGPGHGPGFPLAALNLTEVQREQVKTVMQQHRQEMQAAGKQLHAAFDAQRNAVEAVPFNESLIRSTAQQLANAQADMAVLRGRVHNEVWALLTPDQHAKAKELKAQREARGKERLQRRQHQRQERQQG